jgi:hypothetical protein
MSGCGSSPQPPSPPQPTAINWHTIGTWSGRGSKQTDSFTSDTGVLRIEWRAMPVDVSRKPGTFRLTVHSSISGRPVGVAVDHPGAGSGTAFVMEEPRVFFTNVDADDLDWSFTIQERVP